MPGLAIVGELDDTVLLQAMATKDTGEVERIRKMGQVTTSVVAEVADFLTNGGCRVMCSLRAMGSR